MALARITQTTKGKSVMTKHEEMIEKIVKHLQNNGVVMLSTYTKHTQYNKKHADMFFVDKEGLPRVKRGKTSDIISGCAIRFYVYK
jgi:hypothetical protein